MCAETNNDIQHSITDRHRRIVKLLSANPRYTQKTIAEKLEVSLETIKGDYKQLKKMGYQINSRLGIFNVPTNTSGEFQEICKNDINLIITLMMMSAYSHVKSDSAEDEFDNISLSSAIEVSNEKRKNLMNKSTCYYGIDRLVKAGLVTANPVEKSKVHWIPTIIFCTSLTDCIYLLPYNIDDSTAPTRMLLNEDDLLDFSAFCLSLGTDYSKALYFRIINYLAHRHEIKLSRKDDDLFLLPQYLNKLKELDYQHVPLSFNYSHTPKNFFYVCKLIYSHEKDTVYLLGKKKPTNDSLGSYEILKAKDIDWDSVHPVHDVNFHNIISANSEPLITKKRQMNLNVENICYSMMDVSTENPQLYQITISYSLNNYRELKRFYDYRNKQFERYELRLSGSGQPEKTAQYLIKIKPSINIKKKGVPEPVPLNTVSEKDLRNESLFEYLVYYDYINGQSDIANYFRRFGDDLTIYEKAITNGNSDSNEIKIDYGNNNLRKIIKAGADRALTQYNQFDRKTMEDLYGSKYTEENK